MTNPIDMNQTSTECNFPPVNKQKLVKQLTYILPIESVLYEEEDLRPYECDALSAYQKLPLIVVLPDSIEQVQRILRLCHTINLPVVARGAGTASEMRASFGRIRKRSAAIISLHRFTCSSCFPLRVMHTKFQNGG